MIASDLHGGNQAFGKLIALVKELQPSILVVCGDWSGKRSIFALRDARGSRYREDGRWGPHLSIEESQAYERRARDAGGYIIEIEPELNNDERVFAAEGRARARRLKQWLDYGFEHVGQHVPLVTIPGNDDGFECVDVLSSHPWSINVDESATLLGEHEFFGFGYSNETPWGTEREIADDEILPRLETVANALQNVPAAIGLIHVPPKDTGLDLVPDLRRDRNGQLQLTGKPSISGGSASVREFIQRWQPAVVLSGHCHDSAGSARIGRTLCLNPGSRYYAGMIWSYLLVMSGAQVTDFQPYRR